MDDIKKAYMLGASSYHIKPVWPDALSHQLKVLHDYWVTCEAPQVDRSGKQLHTESRGKLGERFLQPEDDTTLPNTGAAPHLARPETLGTEADI